MGAKRYVASVVSFLLWSCLAFNCQAEKILVVSAAASLKDVFTEAGKEFERDNPGTKMAFNFASATQLASQIEQGAPVDVFASADLANVQRLVASGLIAENAVMARNKLTVIVSKNSRTKIESLADLPNKGVRLVLAAKQVPATKYALQFLKKVDQSGLYGVGYSARVLGNLVSEEPDVRMVAMKVAMGEGDVGVVYASDVSGDIQNKVNVIAIPDQLNVMAEYGVAIVKNSAQPDAAKAFYKLLRSPRGGALLAKNGLLPVPEK